MVALLPRFDVPPPPDHEDDDDEEADPRDIIFVVDPGHSTSTPSPPSPIFFFSFSFPPSLPLILSLS